jgi:predicted transcriptional regulator
MSDIANPPKSKIEEQETERLRSAVEEARAAMRRGKVVPHERVREWLRDLAEGKRTPYPRP